MEVIIEFAQILSPIIAILALIIGYFYFQKQIDHSANLQWFDRFVHLIGDLRALHSAICVCNRYPNEEARITRENDAKLEIRSKLTVMHILLDTRERCCGEVKYLSRSLVCLIDEYFKKIDQLAFDQQKQVIIKELDKIIRDATRIAVKVKETRVFCK